MISLERIEMDEQGPVRGHDLHDSGQGRRFDRCLDRQHPKAEVAADFGAQLDGQRRISAGTELGVYTQTTLHIQASASAIGRTVIPASSKAALILRARTTAEGLSPCTQIVSILTGILRPLTVVMAPSSNIRTALGTATSGSWITDPSIFRETSRSLSS